MEEVKGSNPFRSTKTFQTLSVPPPATIPTCGVQPESLGRTLKSRQASTCTRAASAVGQRLPSAIVGSRGGDSRLPRAQGPRAGAHDREVVHARGTRESDRRGSGLWRRRLLELKARACALLK